jgi:hypothetical protein
MSEAFEYFQGAIRSLAMGDLDGYLDFTHKGAVATNPILLLQDVGMFPEMEQIRKLFIGATLFVTFEHCLQDDC